MYIFFRDWIGQLQKIAISFNFDQHLKGFFDLAYKPEIITKYY